MKPSARASDRPAVEIGYARGAFDLFHVGHLNLLRQARLHCDILIAGVVPDATLQRSKGLTPVVPEAERLEIVRHISFVDEAVLDGAEDPIDAWQRLHFTVFFKGDDWNGSVRGIALEAALKPVGVRVVYFPYTLTTSSTRLRKALDALA